MSIYFSSFNRSAPKRVFEEFKAKPGENDEEVCEKAVKVVKAVDPGFPNKHKIDWTYQKNVTNFTRESESQANIDFHNFPFIVDKYICTPACLDKTTSLKTQKVIDRYVIPTLLEYREENKLIYGAFEIIVDDERVCYHRSFKDSSTYYSYIGPPDYVKNSRGRKLVSILDSEIKDEVSLSYDKKNHILCVDDKKLPFLIHHFLNVKPEKLL